MYGLLIDGNDHLFVCDTTNGCIRRVRTSDGLVTTICGGPTSINGGCGKQNPLKLSSPYGIALDLEGNLFVTELRSNEIKKVVNSGAVPHLLRRSVKRAFRFSRLLWSTHAPSPADDVDMLWELDDRKRCILQSILDTIRGNMMDIRTFHDILVLARDRSTLKNSRRQLLELLSRRRRHMSFSMSGFSSSETQLP
jgi:hypothetical protein